MLYSDLDLLLRIVRDNLTESVDKLIVDSKPEFERVQKFVAAFMPQFQGRIELYEGKDSIFDGYGIEVELDRALERKVWLKSGGYLIIDQGEALTAIDVNTGKFVGKRNLEGDHHQEQPRGVPRGRRPAAPAQHRRHHRRRLHRHGQGGQPREGVQGLPTSR
jgi:Rne/Rng family ribonuclease